MLNSHLPNPHLRIDTHRHLGGSIGPEFVWETVHYSDEHKFIAESKEDVIKLMTFEDDEKRDFHRFLDKFRVLDEIYWDETLIDRSIKHVCDDLEKDNIDFAWMDFSINKYMRMKWHKTDAIQFISEAFHRHRPGKVGLILSLKYESLRASQKQYAKLIEDPIVEECLMGIDLVGDEEYFDAKFYQPIFRDWNKAGKLTRAHVGESGDAINVMEAMQIMGAKHIAHGIKIHNHPLIVKAAKDLGVCFDMAVSSNYITGVWDTHNSHPIKDLLIEGLDITIGTDDPVQCGTCLDKEFAILRENYNLTNMECDWIRQTAIDRTRQYATLPEPHQSYSADGQEAEPSPKTAAPTSR